MNHIVAYELMIAELSAYRELSFHELCQLVGERSSRLVRGRDGVDYNLAIEARWRLHPHGDIRVTAFIGDANWGGPFDALDDTIVVSAPDSSAI
jgi:hypothetical protein